jgi:hypothetical protein
MIRIREPARRIGILEEGKPPFHGWAIPALGRLLFDFSVFYLLRSRGLDRGVEACLQKARPASPGDLTPQSRHRLREYLLLGSALGDTFCVLRGGAMSREESAAFLHLSLLAPFYDDLFDAGEFSETRILEIMENPLDCQPADFFEALLIQALATVHTHAPDRKRFHEKFLDLFEAQKEDMAGASGAAAPTADPRASLKKGGVSAQLYRSLLRHPLRPGEDEAFFHLGSLIQFMDDLFDVQEDHRFGRSTFVTQSRDMGELAKWYARETGECLARFQALSYRPGDLRRFLFRVRFILARGSVCLDRFLELQRRGGGAFDPADFSGNQLLVDMEKPGNFFRNLEYCLRFK